MMYLTTSLKQEQPTGPSVIRTFVWTPPATPGVVIITYYPTATNTNTVKLYPRIMARQLYNTYLNGGSTVHSKVEVLNSTDRYLTSDMSVALSLIRSNHI